MGEQECCDEESECEGVVRVLSHGWVLIRGAIR